MIGFDLNELELNGEDGLRYAFPLHETVGTTGTAAVVFEIDPGGVLPTHTDSAEETLVVLRGECEATVGDETLRVLGFFAGPTVLSYFAESPDGGPAVLVNGTPAQLLAAEPALA